MPYIGQRPATGEHNSFKILDDISNYTLTFGSSDIDVSADTITAREHRFVTGQRVTYGNGGGTDPTGLSNGTVYYIIVEDRHTFKLATSASNAVAGTAINITAAGAGAAHTINVAFDGVNTKFKATHTNGTKADISQSGQLMVSVNGVLQQPHDNTTTPTTGYATDHTSTIIFSAAPAAGDQFFGRLIASNFATFDISDNTVDNFTGDGSTSTFTLSKAPPNNESILVTIDGVVQYPDDNAAVRAYTVSENVLDFASAPGNAVEIQVRHIGFAGASTAAVSGFYGRTGNAALKSTDNIVFNNATAGIVTATNITVTGNLTVDGTTTTLDTDLIGVDKLEVAANNTTVAAAITQTGSGDILNLYDGGTEVFTVTDGGNVGINSSIPTARLDVDGTVNVSSNSTIDGNLTVGNSPFSASPGHLIRNVGQIVTRRDGSKAPVYAAYDGELYSSNIKIQFDNDGSAFFMNNVGIGTDNPNTELEIQSATDPKIRLQSQESGNKRLDLWIDGGEAIGYIAADQSASQLAFRTTGSERLRITSGGLIGIGTAVPGAALHVLNSSYPTATIQRNHAVNYPRLRLINTSNHGADLDGIGDGSPAGGFRISTITGGTSTERIRISGAGQIGMGKEGAVTVNGNSPLTIQESDSNSETICLRATNSSGNGSQPGIVMKTAAGGHIGGIYCDVNSDYMRLSTSGNDRVIITNTGEMGIGAFTPSAGAGTLQISGGLRVAGSASASDTTSPYIYRTSGSDHLNIATNGVERLHIRSDGRIAIGTQTINTDSMLSIHRSSSDQSQVRFTNTTTGEGGNNGLIVGIDNNEHGRIFNMENHPLRFGTNNTERLRIHSNGNVQVLTDGAQLFGGGTLLINPGSSSGRLDVYGGSTNRGGEINFYGGSNNDGMILFRSGAGANQQSERMRLRGAGPHLLIGTGGDATYNEITEGSSNAGLVIGSASMGNGGIVIRNSTSGTGRIYFADNSGSDLGRQRGQINYYHNGDYMMFAAAGSERMRISSSGDVGIGENGPTARLHVRSTGITAGAPSEGWPDWNADNDNNAKVVALLETAGNGDVATSGHGASVVLRLGQYYDSRAVISPVPGGGASPSDQGVGHGKDLMVKGGRSDNANGRNGGRLFLTGGGGFNSGNFGNLIGDVILQPQGGYIGLNGQTNPEYPFDLTDGNNRAYFTQGSDSTMNLVLYDNSNHRVGVQAYGGQLRLNTTPTSGGSLESCMRFNTDGDAIIGSGFNEDPTSNRRLVVKDTNSIFRIESPGSVSGEYCQIEFKTGGTNAWIWKNPTSNTSYGGADSLNFYQSSNASISFFTNGNNERLRITGNGELQVGSNTMNFYKNEYRGSVSVTGTNNESFAFEIQGSSYGSGGLLYIYGTSGNVVVNASAEILVNHSADVTIKSMSGAYTQLRIRVKTDNNARAAIYLGRNAGYGSGTTSIKWKFIPYGGTYAYTTESTNNGTDHTHVTQSGSFRITAAGGGAGNVNASGSKNFMIDHPLESLRETTRLAHAAVEGPECNTIYRGKVDLVDGTATVNIDTNSRMTEGTFVALNQNVQCFTTNETGWTAIKGSVSGNLLTITAQDNTCTDTISWMVVGERHDQDIIDNRATDSEGRFIPEVTDEYDPSQFAEYTDPVEPEPEPDNIEERDPTV